MELKWLEDFIALVEFGSFSKAAEARMVTQPAFGRRIRALESWLGFDLVDRQKYPTTLTPAGEEFTAKSYDWVEQFYSTRARMRDMVTSTERLTFVAQHSLTVSFLPQKIEPLQSSLSNICIRIEANNLHDCLNTLMSEQGDFLLCYHSPDIFPQLERDNIMSLQVGTDQLVPVSAPNAAGEPLFGPGIDKPVKLLNYTGESFFGRLLQREYFSSVKQVTTFRTQCENSFVEGLKALVVAGNGLAWLPESAIGSELERGQLVRASEALPSIKLKVMLYRKLTSRLKEVDIIWDYFKVLEEGS
ncbi:LysR family transcriptional regulator [Leucothrix arctica]|uniref:LysR family transcriptional regulator n=1 Tax=Leucothrix arctica TaxID=1481894 RepID=UPI001304992C|nr:LysR family transcriptional regulator [Leucothrix arctica]